MAERTRNHGRSLRKPAGRKSVSAPLQGDNAIQDEDPRERILFAAGPVFAHRGFDGATVREIARAANVNVASIAYYFGDKMGLYLELIRDIQQRRQARYPLPQDTDQPPASRLHRRVELLLSRMLTEQDERSWEAQLLMREMQRPTVALEELMQHYFRPYFDQLVEIIRSQLPAEAPQPLLQQLAFSVIGQCLHYRVGREVVRMLVTASDRQAHFGLPMLSDHITNVSLAAIQFYADQLSKKPN